MSPGEPYGQQYCQRNQRQPGDGCGRTCPDHTDISQQPNSCADHGRTQHGAKSSQAAAGGDHEYGPSRQKKDTHEIMAPMSWPLSHLPVLRDTGTSCPMGAAPQACGNVGSDLHNSLMFKDNIKKEPTIFLLKAQFSLRNSNAIPTRDGIRDGLSTPLPKYHP